MKDSMGYLSNQKNFCQKKSVKPVSHKPCGSLTPVCDDKFLGFRAAALRCCAQHSKTAAHHYRVIRLPQCKKLKFQHVHFLCDFCLISRGQKAAVRLLQGTQDVCTTDVSVRHQRICLMKAARLQRDHLAMILCFIARLPQVCCETYYYR